MTKSYRTLTERALKSFGQIYQLFTQIMPGFKGTLFSNGIFKFLDKEMPKEDLDEIWYQKVGTRPTEEVILSEKGVLRRPFLSLLTQYHK